MIRSYCNRSGPRKVATFALFMLDVWFCQTLVLWGCNLLILGNCHCWVFFVLAMCMICVKNLYHASVDWLLLALMVMCEGTSLWDTVQILVWELFLTCTCSLKVLCLKGWTLRGVQN